MSVQDLINALEDMPSGLDVQALMWGSARLEILPVVQAAQLTVPAGTGSVRDIVVLRIATSQ